MRATDRVGNIQHTLSQISPKHLLLRAGHACATGAARSLPGRVVRTSLVAGIVSLGLLSLPAALAAQSDSEEEAARQAEESIRQAEELRARAEEQRRLMEERARRNPNDPKFAQPAPNITRPGSTTSPRPVAVPPGSVQTASPAASIPSTPVGTNVAPAVYPPPASTGSVESGLKGDIFTFSAFSEPVDLSVLVDWVIEQFHLQVFKTDAGLKGQTVVLSTPITLHKDDVLPFVVYLLEQRDYTMTQIRSGIYAIQPRNTVTANVGEGKLFPTQIIPTPGIRPSQLQSTLTALIQNARGSGAGAPSSISYLDDLGIIIINDAPRVTQLVRDFIKQIVDERQSVKYHRVEVRNIAAANARDRILELLGQSSSRTGIAGVQAAGQSVPGGQPVTAATTSIGGTLSNLSERLTVDFSSNALFFRGREDELDQLTDLLNLVDVVSSFITKWYPVGNATSQAVATEGKRLQLGDSTEFSPGEAVSSASTTPIQAGVGRASIPSISQGGADLNGAGFILYPKSGGFVYRGTIEQHGRVVELIDRLKDLSKSEEIVYEFYKLKHAKAADVASTLTDLINSQQSASRSPLLGRDLGTGRSSRSTSSRDRNTRNTSGSSATSSQTTTASGEGTLAEISGEEVFVIADEPNNQVVIKAPIKLQPQLKRLLDKLDLRRPQVYIEATIVSITDSDNFRLAVEAQQIIGQFAFNTNFGLGSLTSTSGTTTTGSFTSRKNVGTGLDGITAALIRSKDVPVIVNALQSNTNARVISRPQLLVDDNVEAEVRSEDQQPTTTTTQSQGNEQVTGFGGFESAGPSLVVTPQIAEGGYLKLNYEIVISQFEGDPVSPGVPPVKQESSIRSESVTVPSDMTIVVGGLTQSSLQNIETKIPLLGDIPILGTLFKDSRKNARNITFYVFITPKIMRDPHSLDLKLNSLGPLNVTGINPDLPAPRAERMESTSSDRRILPPTDLTVEPPPIKGKNSAPSSSQAPVRRSRESVIRPEPLNSQDVPPPAAEK